MNKRDKKTSKASIARELNVLYDDQFICFFVVPVIEMMEKYDKLESGQNKMRFTMFPSVHDAVLYALSQMQSPNPIITSMWHEYVKRITINNNVEQK